MSFRKQLSHVEDIKNALAQIKSAVVESIGLWNLTNLQLQ